MSTTEKASARCGNTEALEAQTPDRTSGTSNHSTYDYVSKIYHEPFFHLYPVVPGECSKRIIDEATKVWRTVGKSGFPTPMCIDFTADNTTVFCGKQYAIEKTLDLKFGSALREAMSDTGVNYVSVGCVGDFLALPTITFGRDGKPEFIAYIVRGGE